MEWDICDKIVVKCLKLYKSNKYEVLWRITGNTKEDTEYQINLYATIGFLGVYNR